jgi:hypothetical protein
MRTRRTISYLTCTTSLGSQNREARNTASVTFSGCGLSDLVATNAATFGSDAAVTIRPPPCRNPCHQVRADTGCRQDR